eukprot:m.126129 g.126129  ORF g.126129 m.126129 type:complete len:283 (+) comp19807_c0_seq2:78-926(+)
MISYARACRGAVVLAALLCCSFCSLAWALPVGEPDAQERAKVGNDPARIRASATFTHAFVASFSVIVVSEIGDKTFFIAAIMAMRHNRGTVFAGAITALAVMTVLSAYVGHAVTIIPRVYTQYIATGLFVFFGMKLLREGYYMSADEGAEELEEVTQELKHTEEELAQKESTKPWISPVFLSSCTLTFLAEWGDRSQIATIILGAREDTLGVTIGGVLGHALCTAGAVLGGRLVAQRISVRTVTLVGGVVFLIFAVSGLLLEDWNTPPEMPPTGQPLDQAAV